MRVRYKPWAEDYLKEHPDPSRHGRYSRRPYV